MTVKISKGILIGSITVLVLLNGAVLFSVLMIIRGGPHPLPSHVHRDREHLESMSFLHHELDLDEEQLSRVGEIRRKHFDRTRFHLDRFHSLRREMSEAGLHDTPDLEKIRLLAEELGKIQIEIEYERVTHFSELRSLIAPAQRKKFDRLLEELMERSHAPMESPDGELHFPPSSLMREHGNQR